jgi:hypothetical protein
LPSLYAAAPSDFNSVAAATQGNGFAGRGFSPFVRTSLSVNTDFEIITGNIGTTPTSAGANTATGLGSPIGPALISDLVSSTLTVPLTSGPTTASSPAQTKKHHKHDTRATSHAKEHAAKLHKEKLAEQHKRAAAKRESVHDKKRSSSDHH